MKPRPAPQKTAAMTKVEVIIVVAVLAVFGVMLLMALAAAKKKTAKVGCDTNVKQIGLAVRIWSGDHNDMNPTEVSTNNGGTLELALAGDALTTFQVMSNELSSPKVLFCFNDTEHTFATNFSDGFSAKNVSYFVGLDMSTNFSTAIFSGDANLEVGGTPVKPGLLRVKTGDAFGWTKQRHISCGNIGFTDGSVASLDSGSLFHQGGLQKALGQTGVVTNRFAIP
jgi:competence protein ComGC